MEVFDLGKILETNENIDSTMAKFETVKAELSIDEALHEAYSKDYVPKNVKRRTRHKRINGKIVPYTEIIIEEAEFNAFVTAQNNESFAKLKAVGEQFKREASQTAIYKRCVDAEEKNKLLEMRIRVLEANLRERDKEIERLYDQASEPYIDYEEQTIDLEI